MKRAREGLHLSRAALARQANTSPQQIERLENGKRRLTPAWAQRIGPHINVPPVRLIFGADNDAIPGTGASRAYDNAFLEELLTTAFAAFGIGPGNSRMISTGIIELARAGRKNELDHAKLLNQLLISVLIEPKNRSDDD